MFFKSCCVCVCLLNSECKRARSETGCRWFVWDLRSFFGALARKLAPKAARIMFRLASFFVETSVTGKRSEILRRV